MRFLFLILALPMLASFIHPPRYGDELLPRQARLVFTPIALDESAPGRRRLGTLSFLGGWTVRSTDSRFGGISALHVDGRDALALSDSGDLIHFPVEGNAERTALIQPLAAGPGGLFTKRNRDSESLVVDGARLWVGYEGHNQIWAYARPKPTPFAHAEPAPMKGWGRNAGAEAMARLPDGRFLILQEAAADEKGNVAAVLFEGDPTDPATASLTFRYRPPAGYRPVDAAALPDGRILILNRRFSLLGGFTAKLVAARLTDGPTLTIEEELATFAPPVATDNYEAMAVTQENGRQTVWLASDDNFNPLQRTLILKLALAD